MVFESWDEAVGELEKKIGPITATQKRLARFAKLTLPNDIPSLLAAALLKSKLAEDLHLEPERPCTETQLELISLFRSYKVKNIKKPKLYNEASALINYLFLIKRIKYLNKLKIYKGDICSLIVEKEQNVFEVSSINEEGKIFFKGVGGAWPDKLRIRCRKDDHSPRAKKLREAAKNLAAQRKKAIIWSSSSKRELEEYEVKEPLTQDIIRSFSEIIETSSDEKPIQKFIQEHPQIISVILTGHFRCVLPTPQLGNQYIPDFLICDQDSMGTKWIFIELETPKSAITLKDGKEFDLSTRKGCGQILEWREWFTNNLDYARRPKKKDGLGLIDLRPDSEGLVLVGRRRLLNDNVRPIRKRYEENNRIKIHTYDWLIEALWESLNQRVLPIIYPYALKPVMDEIEGSL